MGVATATQIIEALAEVLGKTASSVEAYALYLRKTGRWEPTKRGRGATAVKDKDASKLLLALMSDGPNSLSGWWLDYANLVLAPAQESDQIAKAIVGALNPPARPDPVFGVPTPSFLDYLTSLVTIFREDRARDVLSDPVDAIGCLSPEAYNGPSVEVSVYGPVPRATITVYLTAEIGALLISQGVSEEEVFQPYRLNFVHQLVGWREAASNRREDVEGYDNAIAHVLSDRTKGVRYQRTIGGREISAVAEAMRPAGGQK